MKPVVHDRALLAVEIVVFLARDRAHIFTQPKISEALGVEKRFLEPTLQQLSKNDIISSKRGPTGGYGYIGDPKLLTAADIVVSVSQLVPCSPLRALLMNRQMSALADVSIAYLVKALAA